MMKSGATTPEEGEDEEMEGVEVKKRRQEAGMRRTIKFDDFEVEGAVVYCREGVIVQAKREDRLHSGTLRVTETQHGAFLTWDLNLPIQQNIEVSGRGDKAVVWRPGQEGGGEPSINDFGVPRFCVGSPPSSDWAVVSDSNGSATPLQRVKFQARREPGSPAVSFSSHLEEKQLKLVVEVQEIRSYRLSEDGNQVTVMMKDGTQHNNLIFLDEGPLEFLDSLKRFMCVRRSGSDSSLWVLSDKRVAALDQSLSELNLVDMDRDRTNSDMVWRTISDFQKDPYTTGLSIFSKITDKILFSPGEERRPEEEMAELLQSEPSLVLGAGLDVAQTEHTEEGERTEWQVVTSRSRDCLMTSVQPVARSPALCQLDWELHMSCEGQVLEVPQLLEKVFRGGVEENIRPEVWKFLLGYFQWHQPSEVRESNRKARVEEYFRMKLQWKSMSDDQQNRFSGFRERKTQIEKDIGRTDRSHPFYLGDNNPNVALLEEILMTYVMYNFDLGYVQGMSDLLSPLLFVMKNEVDAFWCFVGFMDRVASNFEFDQGGMKRQLEDLCHIIKYVDPVFYSYLDSKESGNLYFCFRWLLIWFKREFSYPDTMVLWEALWTKIPCKNFHLLVCVALLDTEKSAIIENKYGFTEVLKHVNDMAHRIDLQSTLAKAHGVLVALQQDGKAPEKVVNILGLAPPPASSPRSEAAPSNLPSSLQTEPALSRVQAEPALSRVQAEPALSRVHAEPALSSLQAEPALSSLQASRTLPLPIQGARRVPGAGVRERHGTEGSITSGASAASLDHSSSVEVLSEMEDEPKFDGDIGSGFF